MDKRVFAWVLAAATVLVGRTALWASAPDVSWIGKLPGVSLIATKATADGPRSVYSVSGDANGTMDAVREGLSSRGWTFQKNTDAPVGGLVAASSLIAAKDGARVKVSMGGALGLANMTVTMLRGGSYAGSTSSGKRATRDVLAEVEGALKATQAAGRAASAAAGVTLVDDGLTGSYSCKGGDLAVMGNNCRVSLEGTCRAVKVYGNGNVVLVDTAVRAIHALGERNTVSWSREHNATAPRVTILGGANNVEAAGER